MTGTSNRPRWVRILLRSVGLASLAGVAATGVLIARDQRRRSALTPQEVRDRLRARYAEVAASDAVAAGPENAEAAATRSGRDRS